MGILSAQIKFYEFSTEHTDVTPSAVEDLHFWPTVELLLDGNTTSNITRTTNTDGSLITVLSRISFHPHKCYLRRIKGDVMG